MSKLGKWVPCHISLIKELLLTHHWRVNLWLNIPPTQSRIITSDEEWNHYNHIQWKWQWLTPIDKVWESISKQTLHKKKERKKKKLCSLFSGIWRVNQNKRLMLRTSVGNWKHCTKIHCLIVKVCCSYMIIQGHMFPQVT